MGLFKKKKETTDEAVKRLCLELTNLVEKDSSLSVLFLCKAKTKGTTLILGPADEIYLAMESASRQDDNFSGLLKTIGLRLIEDDNNKYINEGKGEEITLPDGTKAVSFGEYNIEKMSDKDIDDIIEEMLKGSDGNNPEE